MKIYLMPGLGFDQRIFEKLNLEGYKYSYINWIEPDKNEHIKSYARQLSANIQDSSEKIILIGHSMGGVLCQEIAAIKKVDLIVLISSIKSRSEIPFRFKLVSPLLLSFYCIICYILEPKTGEIRYRLLFIFMLWFK